MKDLYKVYGIDPDDRSTDDIDNILDLTDEEFMSKAEEQGLVWSLEGFQKSFNDEDISPMWFIRIVNSSSLKFYSIAEKSDKDLAKEEFIIIIKKYWRKLTNNM